MQIIAREQDLQRFVTHALTQKAVACDTEFVRVRTYYPELALIQMATSSQVVLVDPLLVKDFTDLKTLFESKDIVKIFHAPRQDLELMRHALGINPCNIFDTQIAAALNGLTDQVGYEALTREVLGIQLDKSSQFTNWLERPLSEAQLDYAAADVIHLLEIYKTYEASMGERFEWARELCKDYDDDALYDTDLTPTFVKWAQRLKKEEQRVRLWIAMDWREERARKINRPRMWVLKDPVMLAIARGEEDAEIPPGLQRALKVKLAEAQQAVGEIIKTASKPLTGKQKTLLEETRAKLAFTGAEHGVPARFLATREELDLYIRTGAKPANASVWKNSLFWDKIDQISIDTGESCAT